MRQRTWVGLAGLGVMGMILGGCRQEAPAVPRVPASSMDQPGLVHQHDPKRPLQTPADGSQGPMYDDVPLVDQRPPEQREFIEAYNRIGRPKIVLFVNRTLEGQLVPIQLGNPPVGHEVVPPPGINEPLLRPGEYDEAFARSIDYQAIETIMTDWLAANGQTILISPGAARQQLSANQVDALQSGDAGVVPGMAKQLQADVLVQVQIRPTRQTTQGLELRAVVEAINLRDGQSIARAVVDMQPPLAKTTINKYTRFLARKLMDGMTQTWVNYLRNMPAEPARPSADNTVPPTRWTPQAPAPGSSDAPAQPLVPQSGVAPATTHP